MPYDYSASGQPSSRATHAARQSASSGAFIPQRPAPTPPALNISRSMSNLRGYGQPLTAPAPPMPQQQQQHQHQQYYYQQQQQQQAVMNDPYYSEHQNGSDEPSRAVSQY